ncbi:hypothetical protein SAMN05661008_00924 [Alkalithermobacter thermoalcaliphilus JW-YL-7 = DSM 7308]|uniref:Uncharacterized protein n=1 Tax=Alkalithermobacter thermoalcaliphilus JW-YL-7 = DSM 7308 TaxID=1121328 RepID=A0A150FRL7_CLOPD|nr:hypothetical protein JWYL7_0930 [[Clostridium] paradoxum JW-YL-7 = DSM 7308]SHK80059.1 hypothetical protein SAMN05661008_00924 [[Clostridium] paradoxum JW-YL-7 = DSM 7308]
MNNVLYNYSLYFLLIAVICGYMIYIYKKYEEKVAIKEARELAYKLMLTAEKLFVKGDEKFIWVVNKFYNMLPEYTKNLFTEEDVENFIQKSFDEIKDILDDGMKNNSINK